MNALQQLRTTIANFVDPKRTYINKFNDAFMWAVGGGQTTYDINAKNYIDYGYKINPLVYAPINQMATKTASIPYYIKKIEDEDSLKKMNRMIKATNNDMTIQQKAMVRSLETKAYSKDELPFPLENPNPLQSWAEWMALYKTFIKTTGNVYQYNLMPSDGANAGTPIATYLLPSHLVQIVVKENTGSLGIESPIDHYILTVGKSFIEFEAEHVIHIKYSNPEYGNNGEHLYGVSPLRAALKNIESSNEGLGLNIKTLKSGGAFGFIHAKQTPLTKPQADELKERMVEMDNNPDRLAKIAGFSAEVGFTRISLTSDELKPFDYLKFDKEMIAECLDWAIDSGDRGDFGGTIAQIRKKRITDNIQPDLKLLADAWNKYFIPKFKGYENTEVIFDISELPEMQVDMGENVDWLLKLQDAGNLSRNGVLEAIKFPTSEDPDMDVHTVKDDVMTLSEAIEAEFSVDDKPDASKKKFFDIKAGFNPNQPRDASGQWGSGGASANEDEPKGFEGSKIRDENGKLKTVYHGTTLKFDEFKLNENPKAFGTLRGFYFAMNKENALDYGSIVKEVNLNAENPFLW